MNCPWIMSRFTNSFKFSLEFISNTCLGVILLNMPYIFAHCVWHSVLGTAHYYFTMLQNRSKSSNINIKWNNLFCLWNKISFSWYKHKSCFVRTVVPLKFGLVLTAFALNSVPSIYCFYMSNFSILPSQLNLLW